jgi:AraC-like DNA-binding protein
MSTSYLTKLIKRETGSTFKVLVQQQRMAVARRLLQESDLSVTDVARNVGYANMSFFYRVFEREYGMRPGECRRRVEP